MMLGVLLVTPLAGTVLLWRAVGRAATVLHALTAGLTLTAALAVSVRVFREGPITALDGFLRADALSAWMIALIGIVAALAASEAPRYLTDMTPGHFYPLFHLFVFTMLVAVSTDDVGLMWVAIEGTTLASVFLVNFERTRASLEASYKYLLLCSIGIAIAFLGTVLVYFAGIQQFGDEAHALRWTTLQRVAPGLAPRVMELAFVFLVVGYGTKAGLAPMHTWLPDAHSEAPAPVSALMSGVLLSVGLYAILRFKPAVDAAAAPGFAESILLALGLLSVSVAAAFLWISANYKRMLAYSSVEHIGLVCLGLGVGSTLGTAGALLHIANHALAKTIAFLVSGRIRAAYGSTEIAAVSGLMRRMPRSGALFLAAMLALVGLPPFGLFVSEVMILAACFEQGLAAVGGVALLLLVIAFAGLLRGAHSILYGTTPREPAEETHGWRAALPGAAALLLLLLTGLAWPPGLGDALDRVAAIVGP
jgi:hydrogenase-4 component F